MTVFTAIIFWNNHIRSKIVEQLSIKMTVIVLFVNRSFSSPSYSTTYPIFSSSLPPPLFVGILRSQIGNLAEWGFHLCLYLAFDGGHDLPMLRCSIWWFRWLCPPNASVSSVVFRNLCSSHWYFKYRKGMVQRIKKETYLGWTVRTGTFN